MSKTFSNKLIVLFENNMHIVNFKHFSTHAQETLMSHHIMRWKNVLLTKSKLQVYREYNFFCRKLL